MRAAPAAWSRIAGGALSLAWCAGCWPGHAVHRVGEAMIAIPPEPAVRIRDADKFLNDLKLSPYWKVEMDRAGSPVATARSVAPESPFAESGREFLFELMARPDARLAEGQVICNPYLPGYEAFSSFTIQIVFRKPSRATVCPGAPGDMAPLRIFESWEPKIGPNSYSELAIPLGEGGAVFLVLSEQGRDPARKTTARILPAALREAKRIADLPDRYRVDVVYRPFLALLFDLPLKDHGLGRFPGLQDRDTFYGCFAATPGVSYEGINLRVSHPEYCPNEGTRESERLRKAEYVGRPYEEGDAMFFLIEDNAVYLPSEELDRKFGTFSGTNSFDGILEVLNADGAVLLKTTAKFKGWEM